jgi:ATP-dependent Clp protease ATP-binding subunit ClpA
MSATLIKVTVVVRELEEGVLLREALLFPEVLCCDTSEARQTRALRRLVEELCERTDPIDLHRRKPPEKVAIDAVEVEVEPTVKSAAWRDPVRLQFHAVRWRHGDDAHVAYVPAIGIEVVANKAEDLGRLIPEHVRLALRRTGDIKSLFALAKLQRTDDARVEQEELSVAIPGPKERAVAQEKELEALGKAQKLVIEDAGQVLSAHAATLPPAYELDATVEQVAESLTGRSPRSVLLVGPAGVGKTAAVYELVRRRDSFRLGSVPFWATSGARLVAGMSGFGAWQERCQRFVREAHRHGAVVHLGNLVELIEVGKGEMIGQGIASFLRPYIARGELLSIVECTPEQVPVIEKQDPHLLEVFHPVKVEEPTPQVARRILEKSAEALAKSGRAAAITPAGLDALDRLHRRYAGYSAYPGRPLRFLRNLLHDAAGGDGKERVSAAEVAAAFAKETGLPAFMIDDAVPLDLATASRWFAARVIGQTEAVNTVTDLLAGVKAGLNRPRRPIASLLFIGPTGVGKTEMAKSLAAFFFGDAGRVSRFDMSEYSDPVAVRRLVGGHFGSEGLLTAKVREQPFSVVLLDEFEKADPSFFDLLLQVLGEARLTDAAGRVADFSNAIVVMTSNLGAESFQRGAFGLGATRDGGVRDARSHFVEEVRSFLRPELFNRVDRIVPFLPLDEASVRQIVDRELALLARRDGFRVRGLELDLGPGVRDHLAAKGYDRLYGARPLKRVMERELLVPLADGVNGYAEKTRLRATVSATPQGLRVSVKARTDDSYPLSPVPRGEGRGEGRVAPESPTEPLTLTPSPEYRGEGTAARSSATAYQIAHLAEQCAERRRDVQALQRSPVVLSLRNELFAMERFANREACLRRRKKLPPTYDQDREKRLAKLKALAERIEELAARSVAMEDRALTAVYEDAPLDVAATEAELNEFARDWRDLLLALYALRHAEPDHVALLVDGVEPNHVFRLAAAYRTAALALDPGAAVEVVWFTRHSTKQLRRHAAENDAAGAAFLSEPRKGIVGIVLNVDAPYALPHFEPEKGWHVMQVANRPVAQCLVDTAIRGKLTHPRVDVATPMNEIRAPLRRRYALDTGVVKDELLGRELQWDGKDLAGLLASAIRENLELELKSLVTA